MAPSNVARSRKPYCYAYPRPALAADVVFLDVASSTPRVLLIERRAAPFEGRWALPGGFVDEGEDLPDAARRELAEETGIRVPRLFQLGAYGKVDRDPRGRTVSVVFIGLARGKSLRATAGDDAAAVRWFSARRPPALAFDHRDILRDALARLRDMAESHRLLELLPRRVASSEIEALYAAVLDGNVRRRGSWTRELVRRGLLRQFRRRGGGSREAEELYERTRR